jgi:hypothetical protein
VAALRVVVTSNASSSESRPCAKHERLGPDGCENLQDRWNPTIHLDEEPSILVRQPDPTAQLASQDHQLMSKHRVLGFKPQLRPEWRGQDSQNETEQPDHSASLGDSITSATRMEFSVPTAFEAFGADNDPYGEHDFGSIEFSGERYFWNIDYYDRSMEAGSENPADAKCTVRILTVMRADEY